jgi:hypothetical protein
MLHDPGSYTAPPLIETIDLAAEEMDTLKNLGQELAGIAALPAHRDKAALWRKLNDLESERPMVWINEIPWHEMNVNEELTLRCKDPWARELEDRLRKEIYQWKHMPADMVVSDFIECLLAIHSTDFGVHEDVDIARTDEASDIVSRHFNAQIKEPEDLEKIKMPVLTHYAEMTELAFEAMTDLFADIIPVQKVGQTHIWFSPWDYLIRWWGIQEAMIDLITRPQLVHDAVERMVQAWMTELDQFEEQNLLSLDCRNIRIGSGGYGYTGELPGGGYGPDRVRPKNMWGCSNAQIFSDVSPEMHWEFAIEHDLKWLARWGLTYYGCCEPLDKKMSLLKKIPNLRKISVSPWNDMARVVKEAGSDYVLSVKPSPAIFAEERWNPERAKQEIHRVLELSGRACHIEFIMKDISTVSYKPERLWEWETLTMETIQDYYE